ncbi:MAG: cyclic nucleotide-binding domain-containing protein [Legionella sp.]
MDWMDLVKKSIFGFNAVSTDRISVKTVINPHHVITQDFSEDELTEFYSLAINESFEPGQIIFNEHDQADTVHIIVSGEAEVYLSKPSSTGEIVSHVLAVLDEDDVIGDMALVENKPRSASVRAKTELTVLTFKLDDIKSRAHISLLLTRNMAKLLSERLRFNNQVTVKKMEETLLQAQARNVLGVFMVAIFWLISLYTLSLTSLIGLEKYFSNTTFLSVSLIVFFASGIVSAMLMTGLPLSHFGISGIGWRQQATQALIYTLPLLVLFVVIKMIIVDSPSGVSHLSTFSGFDEGVIDGHFSLGLYISVIVLYAALCPVQELITRSAMQTTFYYFLPGNELFRKWNAILLSNIIFSSAHSHLSFTFAMVTFIPGLFWGWLFHKQRSFIGVSVSHVILGVWVIFIVGVKGIAYG